MIKKIDDCLIDNVFEPLSWFLERELGWKSTSIGTFLMAMFFVPFLFGLILLIFRLGLSDSQETRIYLDATIVLLSSQAIVFLLYRIRKEKKLADETNKLGGCNPERENDSAHTLRISILILALLETAVMFWGLDYFSTEVLILLISTSVSLWSVPIGLYFIACTPRGYKIT